MLSTRPVHGEVLVRSYLFLLSFWRGGADTGVPLAPFLHYVAYLSRVHLVTLPGLTEVQCRNCFQTSMENVIAWRSHSEPSGFELRGMK